MNYKICTSCKIKYEATTENFALAKKGKYGLYAKCKKCKNKKYANKQDEINNKRNEYKIKLNNLGFNVDNLPEYSNSEEKIDLICKNGHVTNTSISYAIRAKGCSRCLTLKPYFEISETLESEGYLIITKEDDFKGSSFTKIEYICPNGHTSESVCSSVRQGNRCVKCSYDTIREIHRNNLEDIIELVVSSGYTYKGVINEYINSKSKISVTCKKGHSYETPIYNFVNGHRCNVCSFDSIRGENHYLWKDGISKLNNHLRSTTFKWRTESFKNSNYTCFISGVRGSDLVVHHAKNFSDIVSETLGELGVEINSIRGDYDEDVLRSIEELCLKKHYEYGLGIVMTEQLHKEFHSEYGVKNNTYEQLLKFKEDYIERKHDSLDAIYYV